MFDILPDFIKEDDFIDPRDPGEGKGKPGDLNLGSDTPEKDPEAATKVKEAQTVKDDSKGEEDYLPGPTVGEKLVAAVARAIQPQPFETPEADLAFATDTDIAEQIRDFVRFIQRKSLKVVSVPATSFKVWRQNVTDEAQMIAGYQPNRQRLTIRVDSGDTIHIADEKGHCTTDDGYTLTGETIEIKANTEVWAVAATEVSVSVKGEYYA